MVVTNWGTVVSEALSPLFSAVMLSAHPLVYVIRFLPSANNKHNTISHACHWVALHYAVSVDVFLKSFIPYAFAFHFFHDFLVMSTENLVFCRATLPAARTQALLAELAAYFRKPVAEITDDDINRFVFVVFVACARVP